MLNSSRSRVSAQGYTAVCSTPKYRNPPTQRERFRPRCLGERPASWSLGPHVLRARKRGTGRILLRFLFRGALGPNCSSAYPLGTTADGYFSISRNNDRQVHFTLSYLATQGVSDFCMSEYNGAPSCCVSCLYAPLRAVLLVTGTSAGRTRLPPAFHHHAGEERQWAKAYGSRHPR